MNKSQKFKCECNEGFDGERCENALCDNLICVNGFCDGGKCTCNDGYVKIDNTCEETCALNPCEEPIQTRKSWSCVVFKFLSDSVRIVVNGS